MSEPSTVSKLWDAWLKANEKNLTTSHEEKQAKRAFYAGFGQGFSFQKSEWPSAAEEDLFLNIGLELQLFEARKKAGQE